MTARRFPTVCTDRAARARALADHGDAEWPDADEQPQTTPVDPVAQRSAERLRRLIELAPRAGEDYDPDPSGMLRLRVDPQARPQSRTPGGAEWVSDG
jgi:hypothetical protein